MTTGKETVAEILGLLGALDVRARSMFGGYTIYCDDKVVGLVGDDRFYLKKTSAADAHEGKFESAPPYEGAKDSWLLGEAFMQDRERFQGLVQATADLLPKPKPRKKKAPRRKR